MRLNPFAPVPFDHPWHEWTLVPSMRRELHSWTWNAAPQPAGAVPVVLVRGDGESGRWRKRLGRQLGRRLRVIAPDLPGYDGRAFLMAGRRDPSGHVQEHVADLLAWMNARRIDRAVLCACGGGCAVITEFAKTHPERVARMIWIEPPRTAIPASSVGMPVDTIHHASAAAEAIAGLVKDMIADTVATPAEASPERRVRPKQPMLAGWSAVRFKATGPS